MEGNIYNKISQEINFKLPDINFDSDSDDVENEKPIKPFIRPAAEILFGWDSSEQEELMEILAKMPSDPIVESKSGVVLPIESVIDDDCIPQTTGKLPFMNISLPNGLRNHIPSECDDEDSRIVLPNFGLRDNLDLDKVLDQMDLSNCDTSFFDEVLAHPDVVESGDGGQPECASTLLTKLDEMSRRYEQCRQSTNNSNSENYRKGSTGISLSNLFNQLKYESARDTVILDLRVENKLWSAEISQEATKAFKNHINETIKEAESSEDDSEKEDAEESKNQSELWIDSYRKSKLAKDNQNNSAGKVNKFTTTKPALKTDICQVPAKEMRGIVTNEIVDKGNVTTSKFDGGKEEDNAVPEHVRIKIEKIKQREMVLSQRRTMGLRISRLLPVTEDCPLLWHEEISFDPGSCLLLPTLECGSDGDSQYFRANISLSAPNTVMTMSKVPSPISSSHPNENYTTVLSVLLQLTKSPVGNFPFSVIGLQQIYYEDQLQLSLLCRTNMSMTNLKSELKKYTLREMMNDCSGFSQHISELPLSNLLRILPYNPVLDGNVWMWNNSSVVWKKSSDDSSLYEDHGGCRLLGINTSCVVVHEDFYLSGDFYELVMKLLEKCTFSGLRLMYDSEKKKHLVLAVRGFDCVNVIKGIQNRSSIYRSNVSCTRFEENSLKELVKYFGPRINDHKIMTMLEDNRDRDIANELSEGSSIYHTLHASRPSDIIVLISPMCLDIGWIINILLTTGGYRLVNMTRVELSTAAARQFGINEQLIDNFESTNGPCHLVVLRNEQPMHSIRCALVECNNVIHSEEKDMSKYDQIFYSTPYSKSLIDLLDLQGIAQTPSIRELVLNIPDAPFDDCEQCSFVLLVSDELTRHVAQLLDQMSNLDLLGIKCMSKWPSDDHLAMVQTQFGLRLPVLNHNNQFEGTEGKMRIGVFVVRSMFLIKELEKIQSAIRVEKNLIFAYTMNVSVTFGMVGSFFTSSELISDARRRSALRFLPMDVISKLTALSVLSQFQIIYSPITSALSIRIANVSLVTNQFRKLWFLLVREGFSVSQVVLDEDMQLLFVVQRPNAIFYLIQWAKAHFSDDANVSVSMNVKDICSTQSKINRLPNGKPVKSLSVSGAVDNITFIMLAESLLDCSPEALTDIKVFWHCLEENDYYCTGLSLRFVDGSDVFKLKDVTLRNLAGGLLREGSRYLCLLITGNLVATVIEDRLKYKINLMKTKHQLTEDIYLCCDNNQIIQCCNVLMEGAVRNHSDVDIDFD